jgi:Ca2+-binding EF-hand superfamily protein
MALSTAEPNDRLDWRTAMSLRPHTLPLVAALAAGAFAIAPAAEAQPARQDGRIYRATRPSFDDWTLAGFRELDDNRDGRITAAEWTFRTEDFARADHNGDGVLTQREFLGEADDADTGAPADRRDRRDGTPDDRDRTPDDESRFVELDTNRDHRVSRDEWRGERASFTRLDENRDGYLTRAEMAAPGAITDDFATLDVDRNGVVTRGEWQESAASFGRLDTNGDGRLTAIEYGGTTAGRSARPVDRQPGDRPGATRQSAAYRAGYDRGLTDGRTAGREDRARNQGWDLDGQREMEQAVAGYYDSLGSRTEYQAGYRAAFRIGYGEGFGPR